MQLCHTYGEIQLLFEEYEGSQMKPLTNFDLKPTNLCYVHPYFTPDQWRRLYKKVMVHEGCLAKNEMVSVNTHTHTHTHTLYLLRPIFLSFLKHYFAVATVGAENIGCSSDRGWY